MWEGWIRRDDDPHHKFVKVPKSSETSYEACMRTLRKRFGTSESVPSKYTIVAEPTDETPTKGRLHFFQAENEIPWRIAAACKHLDLWSPEDVVWLKLGCDALGNKLAPDEMNWCRCHKVRPKMQKWRFTYSNGCEVCYVIGQCRNCKRIHWTEG